jgi:hypothetical protein
MNVDKEIAPEERTDRRGYPMEDENRETEEDGIRVKCDDGVGVRWSVLRRCTRKGKGGSGASLSLASPSP